jgi:hypothetical protein
MGLPGLLAQWMNPLLADVMTFVIVFGTPGIFGFLIWELKENWRLFAANRPETLRPVLVGTHGETFSRLLRPGFHSGTIPKRFAKLRRAEHKALHGGDPGVVRKHREVLHHVEIDLQRYVEREFIAWFAADCGWTQPRPQVGEIHLATNDACVHVVLPGAAEGSLGAAFQLVDGRLLRLELSGEIGSQFDSAAARRVFRLAIINVLKTGGIDLLAHSSAAAGETSGQQEIAALELPWAEWVAMWETGRDTPDAAGSDTPWARISVLEAKAPTC